MKSYPVLLSVRITHREEAKIQNKAKKYKKTPSMIVRDCLNYALEHSEEFLKKER